MSDRSSRSTLDRTREQPDTTAAALSQKRRRSLAWAVAYPVVVLGGFVGVFGPRNLVWTRGFMTSFSGYSAGDHVQTTYYLWLWAHALRTLSHVPWLDPFQFAATGHVTYQPFGWPLVLISLPVQVIYGPIAAFNAVFYVSFIANASATFLWVRQLGVSRWAAATGGVAFAFAPFLLAQRWHSNALLSFLLPLTLYFVERALRGPRRGAQFAAWGAALTFVSLTASSEMHLVTYFSPVLVAYIVVRAWGQPRERLAALRLPAAALAVGALLAVGLTYGFAYRPSVRAETGVKDIPATYAPRVGDFVRRHTPNERTTYPGIVMAALGVVGAIVGLRRRTQRPLTLLFLALIISAWLLAMLPGLGTVGLRLYRSLPVASLIQVPGRITIIATLAFAALAAFAVSALKDQSWHRQAAVTAVLLAVMFWDSTSMTRGIAAADAEGNLMPAVPRGAAVLDIPPIRPNNATGSRYMLQIIHNPGPRVGGYSAFVSRDAADAQRTTWELIDLPIDVCRWQRVSREIEFDYVAVYTGLFRDTPPWWPGADRGSALQNAPSDGNAVVGALDATSGFSRLSTVGDVVVYRFDPARLDCRE